METVGKRLKQLGILVAVFLGITFCTLAFISKEIKALAQEILTEYTFNYINSPQIRLYGLGPDATDHYPERDSEPYKELLTQMGFSESEVVPRIAHDGDAVSDIMPPVPKGFSSAEWSGSGTPPLCSTEEIFHMAEYGSPGQTQYLMDSCILKPVYCNVSMEIGNVQKEMDVSSMTNAEKDWLEACQEEDPAGSKRSVPQWDIETGRCEVKVPLYSAQAFIKENETLYQWSDNRGHAWDPGQEVTIALDTADDLILTPRFAMKEGTALGAAGTFTLLPDAGYVLGAGSWKLTGDEANTYAGGITFYVPSPGDYSFAQ